MNAPRIKLRHRFFFALFPPPELARHIVQAMTPFVDNARMMQPGRLHVTLDILNDFADYPDEIVQALIAVGSSLAVAPFDIVFDQVSGGDHALVLRPRLRNAVVEALHRAIVAAREEMSVEGRYGYAFSPHLTLAYRKGTPSSQAVTPIGWTADEVVLVHSPIGQTPHRILGRWALDGEAALVDDGQLALF